MAPRQLPPKLWNALARVIPWPALPLPFQGVADGVCPPRGQGQKKALANSSGTPHQADVSMEFDDPAAPGADPDSMEWQTQTRHQKNKKPVTAPKGQPYYGHVFHLVYVVFLPSFAFVTF